MKMLKIKVRNNRESIEVQELFRKMGGWRASMVEFYHLNRFLFFDLDSKQMTYIDDEQYFEEHESTEVSIAELQEIAQKSLPTSLPPQPPTKQPA